MRLQKRERLTATNRRCRNQSKDNRHDVVRSVRKGTWFSESKLAITIILRLTRYWFGKSMNEFVMNDLKVNKNMTKLIRHVAAILRSQVAKCCYGSVSIKRLVLKKSTGAVFLDIQKAFDRVCLTGLTFKLITYNIPPPLICLLHSCNSARSFQVRVKDMLSNTKQICCGVAQGSLLGPLLFNLYINDIPDYTLTKINMFADDTAVHTTYKRISSVTYALNKHLKLLEKYYDQWKISINVEKSAAVIFTKKRKLPPPPTMYNTTIPWSQSTKYLGIIFDKNLTWRTHIQHTRNKFRKIMFKLYPLIGRNSELSRDNKVLLFTAIMRPILAYGCPVWGYAAKTNINILDTLQNSTIRMISDLHIPTGHGMEARFASHMPSNCTEGTP
ncbi:RNA-directed DNA polymerase from mobile element jockey [Trichonephila clavipes]|nr:RNA-directed DNA polymerase from mobile element jockey [Trichonephila clavipes]